MDEEVASIKKWTWKQWEASKKFEREHKSRAGKEARSEEFRKLFAEADEDNNDRLNLAEWLSFVEKSEAVKAARKEPSTPKSEEYNTDVFNILNKISESTDGVSKEDIAVGFNFARRCITKKMVGFVRQPPISEEIRNAMEPVLQKDVDFIKSWTPEQKEAQRKIAEAKFATQ